MRGRGRRGAAAALLAGLLGSPSARAQPGAAASTAAPSSIDVIFDTAGPEADALLDAIREPLGRLGLDVQARPAGAPPSTSRLSVEVDIASRYDATVIVRGGRTEVRRTVPRDGPPNVVRDEIAEAVRSSVEAELLSEPSAPAPAPAPASPPPVPVPVVVPVAPARAAPDKIPPGANAGWIALDFATLAGIGPITGGSGLEPHLGGGVILRSQRGLRPSIALTGEYLVPFTSSWSEVSTSTSTVALRAVPAIEALRTAAFALDVGAGAGIDILSVSPSVDMMANGVISRVDPILTALATAYIGLTPGVAVTVTARAEWDLTPRSYVVVEGGDRREEIFAPWRVRPVALAGFAFTAIGTGLFPGRGE